jgi:hypothetical protein
VKLATRVYLALLMLFCYILHRPTGRIYQWHLKLLVYRVSLDRRALLLDLATGRVTQEQLAREREAFEHPGRKYHVLQS